MGRVTVTLLVGAVGCNPGGSFEGRIVDGMSGKARAEMRVLARSDSTDLTCQVLEGTTDADGRFSLQKTCSGATYALSLTDESLMLSDAPEVIGGQPATAAVDIHAWRAPSGSGVYKLEDDQLKDIRTFSDIKTETILGTEQVVRYPYKKPLKTTAITAGSFLVMAGEVIDRLEVHPLVSDDGAVRAFEGDVTIQDHVYVGVRFNSDTEYEQVSAAFDTSKIRSVEAGNRKVQYVEADALPPGMYAFLGPNDKRMYIIRFGPEPAEAQAATE